MNKFYLLLLVALTWASTLNAQSLKRYKEKAVAAIQAKDYSRALEYYQLIINEADDKNPENYYQAAEAARNFRIYDVAKEYYQMVLQDSVAKQRFHLTHFHLGQVLKNLERYDEAKQHFRVFLEQHATHAAEAYTLRAQKEITDCEWAPGIADDGSRVIHLDSTVNTPSSEFNPILRNDNELLYSSVRYTTNDAFTPRGALTRLFLSKDKKQGTEYDQSFDEDLKHTANVSFTKDHETVYYTLCENVNAIEVNCAIYRRQKNDQGWGTREKLSEQINLPDYTATHPSIGFDQYSGKAVLFFTSDRPVDTEDQKRDLNIWCAFQEEDGSFGEPAYIALVNTTENDLTPFFHTPSQTLYFSSNGQKNLGGYDIYYSRRNGAGWETATHMGRPLNSSYDDLYYSLNEESTMAHFSSNRPGSICALDNDLCVSNDIYAAPQIGLRVLTFNKITGEPLFGTEVALERKTTNQTDTQSKEKDHLYQFPVGFDRSYKVEGTKDGYLPDDQAFNTNGMTGGEIKEVKLYLTPAVELDALTFNKVTGAPLPGCKVELFEVQGDELVADEVLIAQQETPGSVQYEYPLNFKKRYMVIGSKPGYSRDTFYVTTVGIPVEPTRLLDSLFLCKQPPGPEKISLYFYNDEPDRRTRRTTTAKSYTDAFDSYLGLQQEFTVAFAYDPEELGKIERFFEEDVRGGYNRLEEFTLLLEDYFQVMDPSDTLKVIIRGFASPRAKNDYNYSLTQRRINSVRNYFKVAQNGLLEPYIDRLIVEEDPRGEDSAQKGISDDIADRKNSVYSVAASRERRVEILRVVIAEDACENTLLKE